MSAETNGNKQVHSLRTATQIVDKGNIFEILINSLLVVLELRFVVRVYPVRHTHPNI